MDMIAENAKIDFSQVDFVSQCLKVLANPDRLKILCVLVDGEMMSWYGSRALAGLGYLRTLRKMIEG